jgi:hypothetical protein
MVEGILEYRLRQVAKKLDEAAADLKASIEDLERTSKGVNGERGAESEAGRRSDRVEEGP